ncbi:MAG: beta-glucosidase BglX [Melioribacteraceae bacterium]
MKKYLLFFLICTISFAQKKTIEQRVDSVLTLMTLDEKVGQLVQFTGGFDTGTQTSKPREGHIELIRLGKIGSMLNVFGAEQTGKIQKIALEETRLKIPLLFGLDVIHGFRTTFPVPLAEASSWDLELVERSARMQAIESSSSGIHWTFTPMVDIARDPRWGRIVEGSGEDTYLGSMMGAARVKGYQGNDLSLSNTIAACVKHFAGYGAAEGGRDYNTVDLSERTFREIYLPPFKKALEAGVATFMVSFNEIGGVPASANKWLLKNILREEWKFKGPVVSDWNSIGELIPHGVAKDLKHAAEIGINAGVDIDMEANAYNTQLAELVRDKKVSMAVINESVRRVLRLKFQLGLFDDPYKYCDAGREKSTIRSGEMIKSSLESARNSIVLLKNKNNLLPLNKNLKKIAVIGPLANSKLDPLGPWYQQGWPSEVITVFEGIKNKLGETAEVVYEQGCILSGDSKSGFSAAVSAAMNADVVILCIGESLEMSGEAHSRASLDLPGPQNALAEEIYKTGKPVVAVLMNGRPLTINYLAENIPAILETWFLGNEAGNAIADVLFGDHNPSGKLPVTFPRSIGQVPLHYNYKNTGRPYNPEKPMYTTSYMDFPNAPLYPFGFGLSYTTFEYSDLKLSGKKIGKNESITVSINVKNTGARDGEEVVQLYIRDLVGSVTRPVKELKDFSKIYLKAGETKPVKFIITPDKLKFYDINMKYTVEPGDFKVFVGTNSVDLKEADFSVID